MAKRILFLLFMLWSATSFAQSAKITKLAKKQAKILCECPSKQLLESVVMDFRDKKISPEEFKEGMKMTYMAMTECMRPLDKKIKALSKADYEIFSKEAKRYENELCPYKE